MLPGRIQRSPKASRTTPRMPRSLPNRSQDAFGKHQDDFVGLLSRRASRRKALKRFWIEFGLFLSGSTCVSYAFLQVETHVGPFLHGASFQTKNRPFGRRKSTQKAHIGLALAPPVQPKHPSLHEGVTPSCKSSLQGHAGTGI